MKKIAYWKGRLGGIGMNLSEWLTVPLISRKPKGGVIRDKMVRYGEGSREYMNLIYDKAIREKDGANVKQPLLFYIHGGGWCSGVLALRDTYCQEFAQRGWFAVNVGYEYAPMATFPYQFKQLFKAIDWLYDHSDELGIDMNKVLLAGESAGGYFITYVAAMTRDHSLYEKLGIEFKHKEEFKVNALISNCGAIDITRLTDSKFPGMKYMLNAFTGIPCKEIKARCNDEDIKLLSPPFTADFPPTMLIYASHDLLRYETWAVAETFKELGIPHKVFAAEGIISMHAFPLATIEKRGKECLRQTIEFITPYFEN